MSSTPSSLSALGSRLGPRLDKQDKRMLLILLGLIVALFVLLAVFTPAQDPNTNPLPSTYLSGQHGAKAAFTLLQRTGYSIERWEQPLSDLAAHAGPGTVVILADPATFSADDRHAVAVILNRGGRVLATGFQGGLLLPGNRVGFSRQASFAACEAQPEGLQPLAGDGPVWITPAVAWKGADSETRVAYTCAGEPVVVEYPVGAGAGRAIWWAGSTPLENGSIERGHNLELLLNSIGPAVSNGKPVAIYWDESLHGSVHSPWDYVTGPVWPLFLGGAVGMALLVVASYSRRSGPVRPLLEPPRTTPIEFLDALGSLYRSTGATTTALQIAWERFRAQAALLTGQRTSQMDGRQLAAAIERRFGHLIPGLEAALVEAEEACWEDQLKPARALVLVRTLRRCEETLRAASRHTGATPEPARQVTLGT